MVTSAANNDENEQKPPAVDVAQHITPAYVAWLKKASKRGERAVQERQQQQQENTSNGRQQQPL